MIELKRMFDTALIDNSIVERIEDTLRIIYEDFCSEWGAYPSLTIGIQIMSRGGEARRAVVLSMRGDEQNLDDAEEPDVEAFNAVSMYDAKPSGVFGAVGSAHVYANMLGGALQVSVLGSRTETLSVLLAYETVLELSSIYERDYIFRDSMFAIRAALSSESDRAIRKYERKNARRISESSAHLRYQSTVIDDVLF